MTPTIRGIARSRVVAAAGVLSFLAATGTAQDIVREPAAAPGLLHVGPFYVTPSFRISSLGLDTNVFYTSTDRRTDFIAHGGPGLEMVVPVHGALTLRADGTLGYLYYARTKSQRRLTGAGLGRLAYEGDRLHTGAQYSYTRSYGRLGFEVDRRVEQEQQQAQADLRYAIGSRFAIGVRGAAARHDIDAGQEFFGADLRRNLTRDAYGGAANLSYALTPRGGADRLLLRRRCRPLPSARRRARPDRKGLRDERRRAFTVSRHAGS